MSFLANVTVFCHHNVLCWCSFHGYGNQLKPGQTLLGIQFDFPGDLELCLGISCPHVFCFFSRAHLSNTTMCRVKSFKYKCEHIESHCISRCHGTFKYNKQSGHPRFRCSRTALLQLRPESKCGVCQGRDLKGRMQWRIDRVGGKIQKLLYDDETLENFEIFTSFHSGARSVGPNDIETERMSTENNGADESENFAKEDEFDQGEMPDYKPEISDQPTLSLQDCSYQSVHDNDPESSRGRDNEHRIDDDSIEADNSFQPDSNDIWSNPAAAFQVDINTLPSDFRTLLSFQSNLTSAYDRLSSSIDRDYPSRHKDPSHFWLDGSSTHPRRSSLLRNEVMPEDVVLPDNRTEPYAFEPPSTGGWTVLSELGYNEIDPGLFPSFGLEMQESSEGNRKRRGEKNEMEVDETSNGPQRIMNRRRTKSMRI